MAIIKCKMCGGDLTLVEGQSVAECEYCGSRQTVPAADSEKKLALFARANRLRADCDFDKAAGIYESVVAEFPEEAEAYWGLVLCKYGIEYVDDPATGKKIPTCHRTLPKPIVDDTDYREALSRADAISENVYQDEAAQINYIQQKILSIVAKEEPYDVFICYKETDDDTLRRTDDSGDAQDLFTELTKDGYRVFFARNTLKSIAAGSEYEPYIYAALSSAKVMLVIGSREEYLNAVWVKNEWARFLDMMKNQSGKVLIPCYKNLDAYDLPRELRNLQALNMSDLTFYPTLKANLERAIPKRKAAHVMPERVVVGGSGNNKIASLLDRGNMALEDGDWAKADSFFEDVLNNDSKNAQAYLGKTLAQEKCRTIDAFIRKRKALYQSVRGQKLQLQSNSAHVEEAVTKYTVPGYVEEKEICELYHFDLSYHSDVADRKQQYQNEQTYWTNHKLLSRAEKFATGNVAENLAREKQALFAALAQQVKQAEAEEVAVKKDVQTRYVQHIAQADDKAAQLHQEGTARREKDYQNWVLNVKSSTDVKVLRSAEVFFLAQGDYQKSSALAAHCRKRIADINAEQDRIAAEEKAVAEAEAERQRIAEEKAAAARKKRNTVIGSIVAATLAVSIAIVFYVTQIMIPGKQYETAEELLNTGNYDEAITAFAALGNYKDSAERTIEAAYAKADAYLEAGRYDEAIAVFNTLSDETKIQEIQEIRQAAENAVKESIYKNAESLLASGDCKQAIERFRSLADYSDAAQRADYIEADSLLQEGNEAAAAIKFFSIGDYSDAYQRAMQLWNLVAKKEVISPSLSSTIAVRNDGTVLHAGSTAFDQDNVVDWTDIVSVSQGTMITLGLKSDGTVVGAGENGYGLEYLPEFSDVVAVTAANKHYLILFADGTVGSIGVNEYGQMNVTDWTDVIAIDAVLNFSIGLKSDGTVLFAGHNEYGQQAATAWSDIVEIDIGRANIFGLKSDGTVVVTENTGDYYHWGQDGVSDWSNIVDIAAGSTHTVGLRGDGTVVAVGKNDNGECNVSGWRNIVAIYAADDCTIGLRADGTVVTTGQDHQGELALASWSSICLPE